MAEVLFTECMIHTSASQDVLEIKKRVWNLFLLTRSFAIYHSGHQARFMSVEDACTIELVSAW
jgi:hypothetical protein